jgi:hypothetical protein
MSQNCSTESCKRSSCALCHCCQQNLCLPHLKEHQDVLVSQLHPLVDLINVLGDRLKALNIEKKLDNVRQKLEQWRVECHQKIDHICNQKYHELDQQIAKKLNKNREEIDRVQSKVTELIREQDVTRHDLDLLLSRIRDLEEEMTKIEQTSFNVQNQSLKIDDSWITVEQSDSHRFDLSSLSSVYKTIECTNPIFTGAAVNTRFLLMYQKPNLCWFDRTLTEVKQGLWEHGGIADMCWSSVVNQFIVINIDNVFLVDQGNLSIQKVPIDQRQQWLSCACSNKSLFLSTFGHGSSIIEYSLLPSIQLIKHWKSPDTCERDEVIHHMRYNNESLVLLISKKLDRTVRIELRDSKTLSRF